MWYINDYILCHFIYFYFHLRQLCVIFIHPIPVDYKYRLLRLLTKSNNLYSTMMLLPARAGRRWSTVIRAVPNLDLVGEFRRDHSFGNVGLLCGHSPATATPWHTFIISEWNEWIRQAAPRSQQHMTFANDFNIDLNQATAFSFWEVGGVQKITEIHLPEPVAVLHPFWVDTCWYHDDDTVAANCGSEWGICKGPSGWTTEHCELLWFC